MGASTIFVISNDIPESAYSLEPKSPSFINTLKLLLKTFLKERVFEEIGQLEILNSFHEQAYGVNDRKFYRGGNSVFSEDYEFKNYKKVNIIKVCPSVDLNNLFENFCKKHKNYRYGKAELMFHKDFIKVLISQGMADCETVLADGGAVF
jgi:hypothetical protein